MMNLDYPVSLEPAEEGGFVVTFPAVPEAITQGEDEEEALARAADALETALEFYTEEGRDLPKPGKPRRGQRSVRPSALICVKLAVYQTMRDEGVRKAELARRLGWHLPQVDRLLDLHHASRLDQAEAALHALGRRLVVDLRP
ncbi:MAG: type II toxin-antitoxin system HicB family antitoxin [Gammaproteobacteria bacterium]